MNLKVLLRLTRSPAAPALAALLLAGTVLGEEKSVKRAELIVREGKGSIYKPVATLHRGDVVNVVGRDDKNSRWLKVDVGGKTGWVYEDTLESRALASGGGRAGMLDASATPSANTAAASSVGLVSETGEVTLRGEGWDSRAFAQKNGLNASGVQGLMSTRQALTPQQVDAFMSQGKVGSAQ